MIVRNGMNYSNSVPMEGYLNIDPEIKKQLDRIEDKIMSEQKTDTIKDSGSEDYKINLFHTYVGMAMQGFLSNNHIDHYKHEGIARNSVLIARALIKELGL